MKVNFDVTITRTGFITIAAENAEEAMKIVNELPMEKIQCGANWADDVRATDAELEMDVQCYLEKKRGETYNDKNE